MSEIEHHILQLKHCPNCDYDVRFVSEPRCPECGETFHDDAFELPVFCSQLQNDERRQRSAVLILLIVAAMFMFGLVVTGRVQIGLLLLGAPVLVLIVYVAQGAADEVRKRPDVTLYFLPSGVYAAGRTESRRIREWKKIRSVRLQQHTDERWRVTLTGPGFEIVKSNPTLKLDFVADEETALRIAKRICKLCDPSAEWNADVVVTNSHLDEVPDAGSRLSN